MKEKGEEKLIIFDRSTNGVIARFDKKKNNSGYTWNWPYLNLTERVGIRDNWKG